VNPGSSDGENWETFNTTSANPNKVIWNETLGEFITVGAMGIIETSPTGRRWTRIPVSTTSTLNSIVWNKDLKHYVIVGNEGVILTSSDGYSWQIESSNLTGIAWSDYLKKYVVVTSTKYRYLSSDDAKRWLSYENFVLDQPIYAIAWSSSLSEFAAGGLFHTICSSKESSLVLIHL
jgi:hypothetical protein